MGTYEVLTALLRDMKFGVRQLLRQPGFASVAILSLALGIGLNTTLFSVVNAVLFRGGHVAEPDRLVEIYTSAVAEYPQLTTSYPDFLDITAAVPAFKGVAAHGFVRGILSSGDRPALVTGETVTANYFDVLGIRIPDGRGFVAAEAATEGSAPVVVLSHALWRQRFGGRPAVGEKITLSSFPYTVVGIAPLGFSGTVPGIVTDFWVPLTMVERLVFSGVQWTSDQNAGRTRLEQRGTRWLFVKGRLAEGQTVEDARAQVETVVARLVAEYPGTNEDLKASVLPAAGIRFHPMLDGYVKAASAGLLAAVGLVLLIACANVASLLLARGTARRRELAIRTAIGASRSTLVRQLLAESVVLAAVGGFLGLLIAWWAGRALTGVGTDVFPIPVRFEFSIDTRVLAFALLASLGTALVFGLLPALSASKPELVPALKDQTEGNRRRRVSLRDALVAGQLALALTLLASGALLARGWFVAQSVDLGFDPTRIASLSFNLHMNGYDTDRATVLRDRALDALRALPGVTAVSYASRLPLSPDINATDLTVPGHHTDRQEESVVDVVSAGPGYFEATGIPIVSGRAFTDVDEAQQRRVAIVNETMARTFWPDGKALGGRVHTDGPASPPYEVIGVARDHKVRSVGEAPRPYLHLPARPSRDVSLIVRTAMPAETLLPSLRQAVLSLEPNIVFTEDVSASEIAATTMAPTRIGALIIGTFGLLALVLATVGLYGVVSYAVSQRTREVGIRMAIGATRSQVLQLILSQGLRLAVAGVTLGALGAAAAGQVLESMLYGVSALDPVALGSAAAVLMLVAVVANLVPARAATKVDPLRALRAE
jgi:putative ABC transport system permease protein